MYPAVHLEGSVMKRHYSTGLETKLRIVRAAADLFHKQGVHLTSPDQIIEASGTGKGQFYHYFKNKDGLVHEVLQTWLHGIKTKSPNIYDIHSWQDLERCLLSHLEAQKRFRMTRGCPLGTVGNEVTENDELLRQDLSLIFEVMKHKFAAFFMKEKAAGRLINEVQEDELADYCLASLQGAMLLGKIKRDSLLVESTFKHTFAYLKQFAINETNIPRKKRPLDSQE